MLQLRYAVDGSLLEKSANKYERLTAKQALLQEILPENSNYAYTTFLLNSAALDSNLHLQRLNYLNCGNISKGTLKAALKEASDYQRVTLVNIDGELLMLAEQVIIPSHAKACQIAIKMCRELPRPDPAFKSTRWMQERNCKFESDWPVGCEEIVFGDDKSGELLEGFSSNFWIVNGKRHGL